MPPDRVPSYDVLVLGGGIVGMACALELAQRGRRVGVLERDEPGVHASSAGAGMLAPLAEASHDPVLFDACRNSHAIWPEWLKGVVAVSGHTVEHDRSGTIVPAFDERSSAYQKRIAHLAENLGEPCQRLDPKTVAELVPDLVESRTAALHLTAEARVDNVALCASLADALRTSGVDLRRTQVERIESSNEGVVLADRQRRFAARFAVVAAGAWSGSIDGLPRLPVRPVRGQLVRFESAAWPWAGNLRIGESDYAVRRGSASLLVGTTVEEAGFDAAATAEGRGRLLAVVRRALPGIAHRAPARQWAGLRPASGDGLPIIGRFDDSPVLYATGHYRNGILLAPWTARVIADAVEANDSLADTPFSPVRFSRTGSQSA